MELSPLVEFAVQLAGQEAIASRYAQIEPEHLLEAVLKASELQPGDCAQLSPNEELAQQLAAEARTVRQEIAKRSIDSTSVRRSLRTEMGQGNRVYDGGHMHRSAAARAVCDAAAEWANKAGDRTLTAVHLVKVLLASPTAKMHRALNAKASPPRGEPKLPLLEQWGRDLSLAASQGELAILPDRRAETKALVHALADRGGQSVLLICGRDELASSVVFAAACTMAQEPPAQGGITDRVVDVSRVDPGRGSDAPSLRILEELFVEAASDGRVILYVPPVELPTGPTKGNPWTDLLGNWLARRSVRCVCRTAEDAYRALAQDDSTWKRCAKAVWLRSEGGVEIPQEL